MGATIETVNDWNIRLSEAGHCGMNTCLMPECPQPSLFTECIRVQYSANYITNSGSLEGKDWTSLKWSCVDADDTELSGTFTFDRNYNFSDGTGTGCTTDADTSLQNFFSSSNCANDFNWDEGVTELDPAAYAQECRDHANGFISFPSSCLNPCNGIVGSYFSGEPAGVPYTLIFAKQRYRWKIPDNHTGSYFKITWEIFTLKQGDSEAALFDTKTYSWSGAAGEGIDRYSDWYEIPIPHEDLSKSASRYITNVRYECYKSKYGYKPQILIM